ncbi:phytanoyl-CoA dioxygenase family protein [Brevundimonas poindexterae]|uniref:phytanoyl-CoA dioxygenase family protein n=1 Tax=Brevundimonas poindexterae TaxID=74325 RepID=UPI001CFEA889|nr:phytanoyl-CoA dioxygenase family protein [Brevundimonas poindexterae]
MTTDIVRFLDAPACATLRATVDRTLAANAVSLWRDECDSDVRIYNAERKVPEFRPLFESMLAHYTAKRGTAPNHAFLMVNRVTPKPGNQGSGNGWHRDTWISQHKVFVFLSDVGEANGPFEYIPGSNSPVAKVRDVVRYRRSLRVPEDHVRGPGTLLTVTAGEGVFFDTTTLHRGSPIREGERYAATLYAFDARGKKLQRSRERFDAM